MKDKKVIFWQVVSEIRGKMAMGEAESIGISISFYGHQIFLFQFSLKIIDENQRGMLSYPAQELNFSPKALNFCLRLFDLEF